MVGDLSIVGGSGAAGLLVDGVSSVLDLQPLDNVAASTLLYPTYLRLGFAGLAAPQPAGGTPLALRERPRALHLRSSAADNFLPLTERLKKTVARRPGELPTRADLLALAAVSDSENLPVILDVEAPWTVWSGHRCRPPFRVGCLSYELGRLDLADRMRREHARRAVSEQNCLDRGEWLDELADSALTGGQPRIRALASLAERPQASGEDKPAEMFIRAAASRCRQVSPETEAGGLVATAADRTLGGASSHWRALALSLSDPVGRAADVLRLLNTEVGPPHPSTVRHQLAEAAACTGAFAVAEPVFAELIVTYRSEGRLPLLAQALVSHAWSALRVGKWAAAVPSAERGAWLSKETNQPTWSAMGVAAQAMIEGLRGNVEPAQELAAWAEDVAGPLRVEVALALPLLARATAAAGAGEYARAFEFLWRMNDPRDPAHHPVQALWSLADLAEAAMHCGRTAQARTLLAAARSACSTSSSPAVRMSLAYAGAILAAPENVDAAFDSALNGDVADWPFERYRASLVYGSWLRRQDRLQESRAQLRLALDGFAHLGAHPWTSRARLELCASGVRSTTAVRAPGEPLSPPELQIARMAAEGRTNREIGERLDLSHRMVGSHLYRMFPKLGITSRSQLATIDLDGAPGGVRDQPARSAIATKGLVGM